MTHAGQLLDPMRKVHLVSYAVTSSLKVILADTVEAAGLGL